MADKNREPRIEIRNFGDGDWRVGPNGEERIDKETFKASNDHLLGYHDGVNDVQGDELAREVVRGLPRPIEKLNN